MRALVVDDNAVNRRILSEILSHWGMNVALASGGMEALVLVPEARNAGAPFTLIILDVQMPDMDGFTVVERIQKDPACGEIVILMLSSTDRQSMIDRCRALGISTYLQKPIRESELRRLLLKVIAPTAEIETTEVACQRRDPGGFTGAVAYLGGRRQSA